MSHPKCHNCPPVESVAIERGRKEPQRGSIESLYVQSRNRSRFTIFFAHANTIRSCGVCKISFTEIFKIPEIWWTDWCRRLNGYFGSEVTHGEQGQLDGYNTWFRFLVKEMRFDEPQIGVNKDYEWLKLNIFTRWDASAKGHVVIVFDSKPDTQRLITNTFVDIIDAIRLEDPYSVHVPFAKIAVLFYNEAVWKIRTKIREVEKSRSALPHPPEQHFLYLHDLARHAIHTIETLDLAARALRSMIEYHDQFAAASLTPSVAIYDRSNDSAQSIETLHKDHNQTRDQFRFYENVIQGLRLRSIANKARLQNEIQYSFNNVAQSIAITSNEISGAIHINSSVMKTVGLTTAAFVPMMYIATVFGMPFFVYSIDHGHLDVSEKFWVYWAVAVPFTCMAGLLGYSFHSMINPGPVKAIRRKSQPIQPSHV